MSVQLFRYLAAMVRNPDPISRQFLRMGMGIETRHRRLAPQWEEHYKHVRESQLHWLSRYSGETSDLVVFGAGRLLDFVVPERGVSSIVLVDRDPLAQGACRKLKRSVRVPISWSLSDISGVLEGWTAALERSETWEEALGMLREQRSDEISAPVPISGSSLVLSLNLLSQLPIMWQDSVESVLIRKFTKRCVADRETEWLEALYGSARSMIEAHLRLCASGRPRSICLISDLEYAKYKTGAHGRNMAPRIRWDGSWICDAPGMEIEITPALYGVDLENDATWRDLVSGYEVTKMPPWLWFIAPEGYEGEQGSVHRVGAFLLERRAGT